MSWTMCTSGAAFARAGVHANPAAIDYMDAWSTQAEGLIEAETGMSIKSNFAGYALSGAASMACAAQIAMNVITYDTRVYIAREADTLLNMNDTDYKTAIKNMKDYSKTTLSNPN